MVYLVDWLQIGKIVQYTSDISSSNLSVFASKALGILSDN